MPKSKVVKAQQCLVRNLHFHTTEGELRDLASQFGCIEEIRFVKGPGGAFMGFCFIDFSSPSAATLAASALNGKTLRNREISACVPAEKGQFRPIEPADTVGTKSNTIFFGGIKRGTRPADIKRAFEFFGELQSFELKREPDGVHSGFGFAKFRSEASRKWLFSRGNRDLVVNGITIPVEMAHEPTGRRAMQDLVHYELSWKEASTILGCIEGRLCVERLHVLKQLGITSFIAPSGTCYTWTLRCRDEEFGKMARELIPYIIKNQIFLTGKNITKHAEVKFPALIAANQARKKLFISHPNNSKIQRLPIEFGPYWDE